MYKIIISQKAKKAIKQLSKTHQEAISVAFDTLKHDPLLGKSLKRDLDGWFTFYIGAHRIVYKIRNEDKTVMILTAGHRSTVYN